MRSIDFSIKTSRTILNLLLTAILTGLLLAGCGRDSDREVSPPPEDVEQEISSFSLTQSRGGHIRWKLEAETATFLKSDRVRIGSVELVIFGDKKDETMTIHGDRGEVNQSTYDVKIMGNVGGISSDGGRLVTEEIYWRDRTGKIYTPPGVKVTITYEDTVITGEELLADPELETAKLKNIVGRTEEEEK